METEDVQRCMRRLMDAEALLDVERIEDARGIVAGVRVELASGGDELTALVSLVWMFVEALEKRG